MRCLSASAASGNSSLVFASRNKYEMSVNHKPKLELTWIGKNKQAQS
jgi:hypothetical protein